MNNKATQLLSKLNEQLNFADLEIDDPIQRSESAINIIVNSIEKLKNIFEKEKSKSQEEDIVNALDNFKKIQNFRRKYNLFDDQQLVIEHKILAECYKICGDLKKAIEFVIQGIKLHYTLKKEVRNDFFLSACYNYLSKLYLLDDNLEQGLLHQENAVYVLEQINIKDSEYLLLMYQILKHLYKTKGDLVQEKIIIEKINNFKTFEI